MNIKNNKKKKSLYFTACAGEYETILIVDWREGIKQIKFPHEQRGTNIKSFQILSPMVRDSGAFFKTTINIDQAVDVVRSKG